MKTLYDLLGALPDDDAEGIRTAFRKAVKATHPDSNPADPDASLKYRQIVRANAILSDPEQRAGYDRLLTLALRQPVSNPKRTFISDTIRKLASDAIAVVVLTVVLIGGYTLFGHLSKPPVTPVKAIEVAARGPVEIAAVAPMGQLDITAADVPRDKPEVAGVANEAIVPSAVTPMAPEANTGSTQVITNVDPVPDFAVSDAKSYRERGIFAYRDGDLHRAIADFGLAIQLEPRFADAYIDRGIVFYRIHEFDRAFADIAQAKRIKNSTRTKTALPAPHRLSPAPAPPPPKTFVARDSPSN